MPLDNIRRRIAAATAFAVFALVTAPPPRVAIKGSHDLDDATPVTASAAAF